MFGIVAVLGLDHPNYKQSSGQADTQTAFAASPPVDTSATVPLPAVPAATLPPQALPAATLPPATVPAAAPIELAPNPVVQVVPAPAPAPQPAPVVQPHRKRQQAPAATTSGSH